MTAEQRVVLSLIRLALPEPSSQLPTELFDWHSVMDFASSQGVLGICLDGVELLPNEQRPPMDILMDWIGQTEYIKTQYNEHKRAIASLAEFYHEYNVRTMVLKGYGLSLYWPKPEHRPVGDVDTYYFGAWELADRLAKEKLGARVDAGHEHHTCFRYLSSSPALSPGVTIENHYDFINVKAHRDAPAIEAKLKDLARCGFVESPIRWVYLPCADFNVIFLIRHLGQHFAAEKVTLRQLLDVGLFLHSDADKICWYDVVPFLKKIGIWTFFNQVCAICVDYFGIELNIGFDIVRDSDLECRIMEDILNPEFAEEKPTSLLPMLIFKFKRWWYNRWKHPLVYNEWLLPMLMTLMWSHLRRLKTIRD